MGTYPGLKRLGYSVHSLREKSCFLVSFRWRHRDYRWGVEDCGPSQPLPLSRRESRLMFFFLCLTRTGRRVVLLQPGTGLL